MDDGVQEPVESFFVDLSGVVGANVIDSEGEVTILDDEGPVVVLVDPDSALEGDILNFTLRLSGPSDTEIREGWQTEASGSATADVDYVSAVGEAIFAPGVEVVNVPILTLEDSEVESDETLTLRLDSGAGALGTILDDDDGEVIAGAELSWTFVEGRGTGNSVLPGDIVEYQAILSNLGSAAMGQVTYENPVPEYTDYLEGTLTVSQGTVVNVDPLEVALGDITAGNTATIQFRVRIHDPFPAVPDEVTAQGLLRGSGFDDLLTTDPSTGVPQGPTVTAVGGAPDIRVLKMDVVIAVNDPNPPGTARPGDTLLYEIALENSGDRGARDLHLADELPEYTRWAPGEVEVDHGEIVGVDPLEVEFYEIVGRGGEASVRFQVEIEQSLPLDLKYIENQAMVDHPILGILPSDDPDESGETDPTRTLIFRSVIEIPMLDSPGLLVLMLTLMAVGALSLSRRE